MRAVPHVGFIPLLLVLLTSVLAAGPLHAFVGVTSALDEAIDSLAPGEMIRVNIILKEQHDLQRIGSRVELAETPRQRRAEVWQEIRRQTERSQAPVIDLLDELLAVGAAGERRILHGVNGINVWLTAAAIVEIATFPAVRSLDWDEEQPVEELVDIVPTGGSEVRPRRDTTWNVNRVRAPEMWPLGYTGEGVLIAVIDTGVNYNHHDLRDHMWDGGAEYPHHGWNFADNNNDPIDLGHSIGHGTRAAGICCGDGSAGIQTGVAPDATVMALKVAGDTAVESSFWSAIDFAIEHDCDVVTASVSWKYDSAPDYASWRQQEDLLLLADILHAQSAGNQNVNPCCPTPYNVSAPGLCPPPWLHPDQTLIGGVSGVTTVGNVDENDEIWGTSSHGPSSWQDVVEYGDYPWDPEMGLLRPDVVAPGQGSISITWYDNEGYGGFSGTSAAAPHIGGAYCLLRQAHPLASSVSMSRALQLGAVELGDPGKDNNYGAGRIDIVESHLLLENLTIQPPTDLAAIDTPGDAGGSIDLSWTLSVDDGVGNGLVEEYEIRRTTQQGIYFSPPLGAVPAGTDFYQDATTTDGVHYYYQLTAFGNGLVSDPSNEVGPVVSWNNSAAGIEGAGDAGGGFNRLLANRTNPFSTSTVVRFELAGTSRVELVIYNVSGVCVRTLIDGDLLAGRHQIDWDGHDDAGGEAASGVYWLRLVGSDFSSTRKILKLR